MDIVRSSTYIKIILLIISASCMNLSKKYDVKFNNQREKLGLPILNKDWKLYKHGKDNNGSDFLIYINPKVTFYQNKNRPFHYSKEILFSKDTIIYESDTYFSGGKFETIDGLLNVSLVVSYHFVDDFLNDEIAPKVWIYTLFSDKNHSNGMVITKERADSTLKLWGIN
jgi:hypothetical protein